MFNVKGLRNCYNSPVKPDLYDSQQQETKKTIQLLFSHSSKLLLQPLLYADTSLTIIPKTSDNQSVQLESSSSENQLISPQKNKAITPQRNKAETKKKDYYDEYGYTLV